MTGWSFTHTPGSLVGFATGRLVALVDLPTDDEMVARLAAVVTGGSPSFDAVLDVLVSRGLRSVASFGVAEQGPDGLRVLVRGGVDATSGDRRVADTHAGLWAEQLWADADGVRLGTADADARTLPLAGGIVLASALTLGLQSAATPAEPLPAPAPDADDDVPQPQEDQPPAVEDEVGDARPDELADVAPESDSEAEPEADPEPEPDRELEPALVLAVAPEYDEDGDPIPARRPEPSESDPEPDAEDQPAPNGDEDGDEEEHPDADAEEEPRPEAPVATMASPRTGPVPSDPAPSDGFIASLPWSFDDVPAPPATDDAPGAQAAPAASTQDPGASEEPTPRGRPEAARSGASEAMVVAVTCPDGHANPVHATACRVCRAPLSAQQPVEVPRPSLGVLRLSNGDVVALERGAVLGRNPRLPQGWSGEQPHLVRIDDPERDVSSQHLEVKLDAWHVLVRDLGSTNGTEVALPGSDPVLLRPHEQLSIEPGTRIVLAGVFDLTYEAGA